MIIQTMKLEIIYEDDEYSDVQTLIAETGGIRVKADLRDGVALIQTINLMEECGEIYGEWVSSAFTLLNRHDDVDHVEFVTDDNINDENDYIPQETDDDDTTKLKEGEYIRTTGDGDNWPLSEDDLIYKIIKQDDSLYAKPVNDTRHELPIDVLADMEKALSDDLIEKIPTDNE